MMAKTETPKTILLNEYTPPTFLIDEVYLEFVLHPTETQVKNTMKIRKNPQIKEKASLWLDGEELQLKSLSLNGEKKIDGDYKVEENGILIEEVPDHFTLEIESTINPEGNKALDGLYKSGNIYCTQNEPEGFRRITFYIDRPDVMAKFTTKVIADKTDFPVLLSNGNPIDEGDLDGGQHFVVWEDPFPKPSYLYALVAGDLGLVKDSYTTLSGKNVDCRIYCDKGNESRCDHAMKSLKNSMKWDEEKFGLEYDLDIYMIVAVDAFNMGAMENKGLNIFNSNFVLANKETATDSNFLGIESVVGHEYFHNWTGNRITCRDWFQLTLKEGLTVYRDQEFSADLNSRLVQRISDVIRLKNIQFVEDAGPTSHPIKPKSYIEINNFYTATVYSKGAEVIRMVATLLGEQGFRKGMDKYFELFDGQAVTTEDFLKSMSLANGDYDFSQFKNWYDQAGTPEIKVNWEHREGDLFLTVQQTCPATPGQPIKEPFHFPLKISALDRDGNDLKLELETSNQKDLANSGFLHIKKKEETFQFKNLPQEARFSLNRGFSAPIKISAPYDPSDDFFFMAYDSDTFNRYEAAQRASIKVIFELKDDHSESVSPAFLNAIGTILSDKNLDSSVKAMLLAIPSLRALSQESTPIDYIALNNARKSLKKSIATHFKSELINLYEVSNTGESYKLDPISVGKRTLRGTILSFLVELDTDKEIQELIKKHYETATNMTEELSGLYSMFSLGETFLEDSSKTFYNKWKEETLVMQKWLSTHGSCPRDQTFERVKELSKDEVFDMTVPNHVRSLFGAFLENYVQFHHSSGRGYKLMVDVILEVDKINPQMASRLSSGFRDYQKLVSSQKDLMGLELKRILESEGISKNVFEIVSKVLE